MILDLIDKRIDRLETKVDKLISFRLMLIGGAATISALISIFITIYFGR